MPLMKCSKNGKSGWKYGNSGACYTGPDGKKRAIKQGLAIDGPEGFKSKAGAVDANELNDAILDLLNNGAEEQFDDKFLDGAAAYISKKTRDSLSKEDFGDPENEKYPIRNQGDLDAAAKLIGRAPKDKQAAIKERIKRIAKRKGLKLPESWQ